MNCLSCGIAPNPLKNLVEPILPKKSIVLLHRFALCASAGVLEYFCVGVTCT